MNRWNPDLLPVAFASYAPTKDTPLLASVAIQGHPVGHNLNPYGSTGAVYQQEHGYRREEHGVHAQDIQAAQGMEEGTSFLGTSRHNNDSYPQNPSYIAPYSPSDPPMLQYRG